MKFILFGRSRSGTTITHDVLKAHKEIVIENQKNNYLTDNFIGGNKMGTPSIDIFKQLSNKKDFKFIHICRDGRDSVSSGMKMSKKWKAYRKWKDLDPYINSEDWANTILRWRSAKNFLIKENCLDIKFEDYIYYPGKNSKLIANFLNINASQLITIEKKLIILDQSHIGCYKDWVPNWKETFHPKAIEILKELNYI